MKKRKRISLILRMGALLVPVVLFLFSCASSDAGTPDQDTNLPAVEATSAETAASATGPDAAVSESVIAPAPVEPSVPQAARLPGMSQKAAPFSRIDSTIMQNAQTGSPSSIRSAAAALQKPGGAALSDDERVLLAMLDAMMTYAYPSEKNTITAPANLPENTYSGILGSLKDGLYDSNATDSDFFTLVMPSLILTANPNKDGFLEEAEESLVKACTLNNDSVLAHYLLGVLYTRTGENEKAAQELQRACRLEPACYETSVAATSAYIKAGWTDDAVTTSSLLLAAYPDQIAVLKLCSEAAFSANDIDAAENYVAQVLQKEPNNMDYILLRAKILFARGEYLKVSSLLDVYQKSKKTSLDYLLLRAELQLKWNKNTSSAAATIQSALEQYPDSDEALLFAAEISLETGNPVAGLSADELVAPVYAKDPANERALEIMISSASDRQDWNAAYQMSSVLITRNTSQASLIKHINLCLKMNFGNEASRLAGDLYRKYPGEDEVRLTYIRVLIASGSNAEARTLIETLLLSAQSKTKSALYYERSRLQSDQTQVLADLRSCLTANPRNEDALFALYELYFGKQDYRKAQYYLKQVIALNANDDRLQALNAELDVLLSR